MSYFELNARTRRLLRGPLKHARKAALATALVPLGAVAVPDTATAGVPSFGNTSRVDATVTPDNGRFRYEFTVHNTSSGIGKGTPVIVDWELPLFSLTDIDIGSIEDPFGWSFEILTPPYASTQNGTVWTAYDPATDPLLDPNQGGDPNLYGPNPQVFDNPPYVLHWYEDGSASGGAGIFPQQFLSGFAFVSDYSSRNAPYMASWNFFPPAGGDPPIPNQGFGSPDSPARQAAQGIPEPASVVLFVMAGVSLLAATAGRREVDE
jgi:hypothetical protein